MTLAPKTLNAPAADIEAVTHIAHEYIESYARGDAERHGRVYHAECLKRRYVTDDASGVTELVVLSPQVMADTPKLRALWRATAPSRSS